MAGYEECFLCFRPCQSLCHPCQISYCSEEHYRVHKRSSDSSCLPFRVSRSSSVSDTYGRYLTATRDIAEGELILSDRPCVVGPEPPLRHGREKVEVCNGGRKCPNLFSKFLLSRQKRNPQISICSKSFSASSRSRIPFIFFKLPFQS